MASTEGMFQSSLNNVLVDRIRHRHRSQEALDKRYVNYSYFAVAVNIRGSLVDHSARHISQYTLYHCRVCDGNNTVKIKKELEL